MPFNLSKITVISTQEGVDKETSTTRWAFDIYQANDIYLYIDKNDEYTETAAIDTITVDNLVVESNNVNLENIKFYRPDVEEENSIFTYSDSSIVDSFQYTGELETDIKNMKISNQSGVVVFRCLNDKVAEYLSDEEEINHTELLKKAGVTLESLQMKVSFKLTITLASGISYEGTVSLDLPTGDVVEEGTSSTEITDLQNVTFKRANANG